MEQTFLVKPFEHIKPQTIQLSTWDQTFACMYTPRLHVFRLQESVDKEALISYLEHGLSKALAEFPDLSSRVESEDENRGTSKLVIDSDSGARLKVLDFTNNASNETGVPWTIEDVAAKGYPPSMLSIPSLADFSYDVQKGPVPAFKAQLSFVRGGAVLVMAYLRRVVDGEGAVSLIRAWAKHTAARSREQAEEGKTSHEACDRSVLGRKAPGSSWSDFPELQLIDPNKGFTLTGDENEASPPSIVCPLWSLTTGKQEALQSFAGCDILQSICALVWLSINKARVASKNFDVSSTADLAIGKSLRPLLGDPKYTGSATSRVGVIMPLGECAQMSLEKAAEKIKSAFDNFSEERFRKLLGCVGDLPNVNALQPRYRLHEGPHLYTNLQSRFGEYEMDWGEGFGKPVAVRELFVPVEGYVVILPRRPDGSLEVMTSVREDVFDGLVSDEQFTRYVELVAR